MRSHILFSQRLLRATCIAVTAVGSVGNVAIALSYPWALPALGVPMPKDEHLFLVETFVSLALGLVALVALQRRTQMASLMSVVIFGKALYAVATFAECAVGRAHPFLLAPVGWDVVEVFLFFLFWIQAKGDELFQLQIDVFEGIEPSAGDAAPRALLLSVPGAEGGGGAIGAVRAGLERRGYAVDVVPIGGGPLALPDARAWDLVIVESPDAQLSPPSAVVGMLSDPKNRELFQGRDAAVLVVSRGARRRTMAAIATRLERAGANVVAARGVGDGAETPRTELESLGASLADRARTRPHWTLLLPGLRSVTEEDRHA